MAPRVDFNSSQGFTQAAGKKKKKGGATKNNWDDNEEEKKEEGGGDDNNSGDKGSGDAGAGAGDGSGDKKEDSNGDAGGGGDPPPEDDFESFMPAKGKKKGKKGAKAEEATATPDPPAEKFDAFHEIKLDDGPGLDLSFDTGFSGAAAKSPVGTWGSNWNTGDSKTAKTGR
jgi:hypothetical protein